MREKTFSKEQLSSNVHPIYEKCELEIFKASDIKPRLQPWLIPGIIPLETTTLFAGYPGIGKSLLLIYIVSAVSNGLKFKMANLDFETPKGKVIIIPGEDENDVQIVPKLIAHGANRDNIIITKSSILHNTNKKKLIDLSEQLNKIEELVIEQKDVKLIVIDPITHFIGKLNESSSPEICNFINNLNEFAKKYNLSIIINKHLRKTKAGDKGISSAISEVAGSGSWVNAPRMSWVISRDHDDKSLVLFKSLKVNLIKQEDEAFVYKLIPTQILHDDKPIPTLKLEWQNYTKSITADEAVNKDAYEKTKLEKCGDFIYQYLKENGQSRCAAIREEAVKKGFTISTYRIAEEKFEKNYKDDLKITRGYKNAKIFMLFDQE